MNNVVHLDCLVFIKYRLQGNSIILRNGARIISLDKPQNLKGLIGADVISIEAEHDRGLRSLLQNFGWVEWVREDDHVMNLGVKDGRTRIPEIVVAAHQAGITIKSINLHEPDLEDVFLKFTGRKIREEEGDAKEYLKRMMRAVRRKR